MSLVGDIIDGLRSVAIMDERVKQLRSDFDGLEPRVVDIDRRLARIEGIIDYSLRSGRPSIERD